MTELDITLNKVRNKNNLLDSLFLSTYTKLSLAQDTLTEKEKLYLLKTAVYFLNSKDISIERFGYAIILKYSNQYQDYQPLYDIAMGKGYTPITKFIELKDLNSVNETFSDVYLGAYQENFKLKGDDSTTYRSQGQMILNKFSSTTDNIAIVAPTSYGKSEMIIKKIEQSLDKRVCILVPSKALLAQTKRTLVANSTIRDTFKKIITHPDMFKESDTNFLAVLTQERLLRLLQKNKNLSTDLLLVDEAHNLLQKDERPRLLAQVVLILQKRNPNFLINFFTPFIVDVSNLEVINHDVEIKGSPIKENMKVEQFYGYNVANKILFLYDQFLNKQFFVKKDISVDEIDFILNNKAKKNIVYLNRPMDAEEVALNMSNSRGKIQMNENIQKVIDSISGLIDPNYNLIKCIEHGIIYHHGGMPEVVRSYIENIFSKYSELEMVVTTSTLLEGVNIPAEKIFLLSPVKTPGYLTPSQFKNLIGRVCRFKEVFNLETGSLKLLEPKIYLIKCRYSRYDFSPLSFYEERVNLSKKIEDKVENSLLKNSEDSEERKEALEYLENMEPGSSGLEDIEYSTTEIARACFENNIYDFDILKNETILEKNLAVYKKFNSQPIGSASSLMEAIYSIFFEGIQFNTKSDNIDRLREIKARNFYSMFISWRSKGSPYPVMINNFITYWKNRETENDPLIYVGSKWGDLARDGNKKLFVNITKKDPVERINLAIAKTKEEQEFVDYHIMKYVEILNELELISIDFYEQVKYGTSDKKIICMLKNGFSMDLAKLFKEKYLDQISFELEQDVISYDSNTIKAMIDNNENEILIFEARSNL